MKDCNIAKWPLKPLGKIFNTSSGGTPSRGRKDFYEGDILWLKSGELNDNQFIEESEEHINLEAIKNSSAKFFPPETVLIAMYGATTGKIGILKKAATTNQAVCGIFPQENQCSKIVFYYLMCKRQTLIDQAKGGAQPNINQGIIKQLDFPVIDINDQKNIVELIETQFTRLDVSVKALQSIKKRLELYRKSVLKSAFNGDLVNSTAENWDKSKFGDVVENYDFQRIPLSKEVRSKRKGGYRYYGATKIVDYVDDFIFEGKYLLIGEDGANLFSKNKPLSFIVEGKFWVNNHAHIVQPKEGVIIEFLNYYFNSLDLRDYITGTAQPKLTQVNMNKISVPLPAITLQTQIVLEIESRFSVIDKIEETVNHALLKVEKLRKSILKSAFEGRLHDNREI